MPNKLPFISYPKCSLLSPAMVGTWSDLIGVFKSNELYKRIILAMSVGPLSWNVSLNSTGEPTTSRIWMKFILPFHFIAIFSYPHPIKRCFKKLSIEDYKIREDHLIHELLLHISPHRFTLYFTPTKKVSEYQRLFLLVAVRTVGMKQIWLNSKRTKTSKYNSTGIILDNLIVSKLYQIRSFCFGFSTTPILPKNISPFWLIRF